MDLKIIRVKDEFKNIPIHKLEALKDIYDSCGKNNSKMSSSSKKSDRNSL